MMTLLLPEMVFGDQSPAIHDKTLVVWAAPANLTQRGGSALTIDDMRSHFDGIVFGERDEQKWMAGSDGFRRTQKDQSAYQAESTGPDNFVRMAIVYRDRQVTIYRNDQIYAEFTMENPPQTFGSGSVVMMGKRHIATQDERKFAGAIDDARVYDVPLSAEQIAALEPNRASHPQPAAWWSFEKGRAGDETGRFPDTLLLGGARIANGKLYLDGKGATLIAATSGIGRRAFEQTAVMSEVDTWVNAQRRLREKLLRDPHRPGYHLVTLEGDCNIHDPNGGLYWKGRYHLFYIFSNEQKKWCWGHVSSADLVHWRRHPTALAPQPGDIDAGIFSGGAFVDKRGVPTLVYWGLGGNAGICMATSTDDNLDHWTKSPHNPVIARSRWGNPDEGPYGVCDPSAVWRHDDLYYMVTGNIEVLRKFGLEKDDPRFKGDTVYLFESEDLIDWKYLHEFYESRREWTKETEDNMCTDFFPLGDKHMMLFISHPLGCQYYLGRYADHKFHPEQHGRMTWVDNAFFAPESLLDHKGRRIMWAWIFDGRSGPTQQASGWSGTMSLPRVLSLGVDGTLRMSPPEELRALRYNAQQRDNLVVEANGELKLVGIQGNSIELELEMLPRGARQFGVKVCCSPGGEEQTLVYYDAVEKKLAIDTTRSSLGEGSKSIEAGPLALSDSAPVRLRVFVDKSVVEVFAEDRQAVMRRIYPTRPDSLGVVLFSRGGPIKVTKLQSWDIMPSMPF